MASVNTNQLLLYGGGLVVLAVGGYLAYTYLIKGKSGRNRGDDDDDDDGGSKGDWCAANPGRCGSGGGSRTGSRSGSRSGSGGSSNWCAANPGRCGDKSTTTTSSFTRISVS